MGSKHVSRHWHRSSFSCICDRLNRLRLGEVGQRDRHEDRLGIRHRLGGYAIFRIIAIVEALVLAPAAASPAALLAPFVFLFARFGCSRIFTFDGWLVGVIVIADDLLAMLGTCRFLAIATAAPPPLALALARCVVIVGAPCGLAGLHLGGVIIRIFDNRIAFVEIIGDA